MVGLAKDASLAQILRYCFGVVPSVWKNDQKSVGEITDADFSSDSVAKPARHFSHAKLIFLSL